MAADLLMDDCLISKL